MAREYWHSFVPSFSVLVVVVSIVLAIVAFYTGWRSVTVRPRKVNKDDKDIFPDRPKFKSSKVTAVKDVFTRSELRKADLCDSVIYFCSKTIDFIWALLGGVAFAITFGHEHWDGMVQWWINHLAGNDGAAWGDIMAYVTLVVISSSFGCLFYVIREYAQYMRGCLLLDHYLNDLKRRPILVETPTLYHRFIVLKWAIESTIEEYQKKKAEEEAEKRRREIHRTKKPYNCEIIDMKDHRIAANR